MSTIVGGGEARALIEAPAVAEVRKRCMARPAWLYDRPLAVEPDLWQRASTELEQIMRDRGWWVMAADIGQPNFLLHGVPIVMR